MAAVNGPAVGIGASLAFSCDLVLAAESAYFGLAFVNIRLMPDGGSTLFVPAAIGKARSFQMALLGERVPAERALDWGLVVVHPDERLLEEANALVEKLAAGPTRSYAGSKQALNRMLYPTSTASSTSRPSSSTGWRGPRTSRRGCSRSSRNGRRRSRGRRASGPKQPARPDARGWRPVAQAGI